MIDKCEGETSYDVVRKVKSAFGGSRLQKVGHAGTLDPFATGLLIILLGQGTKLSPFIMSGKKVYLATMGLGVETDTLDSTGRVIRTGVVPEMRPEYIQDKARGFVGDIEQLPPVYSAVKYKGVRAYKLARRGIEMDLQKRKVTVYSLRILSVDLPDITMEVKCSSGTYIRSLAADLGRELGPGGYLKSLRRLASGPFEAQNALSSREIPAKQSLELLKDRVISLKDALPDRREIEVGDPLARRIRDGYQPAWEELADGSDMTGREDEYIKLVRRCELVAIVRPNGNKGVGHGRVKIERVFADNLDGLVKNR